MRQVVMLSATGTSRLRRPSSPVTASGSQSIVSGKYWRRRGGSFCAAAPPSALLTSFSGASTIPAASVGWAAGIISSTTMPPSIAGPAKLRTSPICLIEARLANSPTTGSKPPRRKKASGMAARAGSARPW